MSASAKAQKNTEKKGLEEEQRNYAVVMERLQQLVKKGVIGEFDLSDSPVFHGDRNLPRIIWTVERMMSEGHLKGVEDAVKGFCYFVGVGLSSHAEMKKKR
jgi:hypothetical protein